MTSPALVGRDGDLLTLRTAFEAAASGTPQLLVVRGEAGIGKSRLVREATEAAERAGCLVALGECLDIGPAGLPYLPVSDALRDLARRLGSAELQRLAGPGRDELAAIAPQALGGDRAPASPDGGAGVPPPLPSGLAQARLFERFLDLLGTLAERSDPGPMILVVEDVHWIDRATRDLLTYLAHNVTGERLAIVLTCRTDDLPEAHPILAWLAGLERLPGTTVVALHRLGRAAVLAHLRSLRGTDPPTGLVERIWARSEGNPLFVEELWEGAGGEGGPPSSRALLLPRIGRLGAAARAAVDAASIARRPADERLLAAVLERPEPDLDEALRDALSAGVLEVDPATDRYRFRHELLREAVERELRPGLRRRLHERFLRCLAARPELADPTPAGAAAELAHHAAAAGLAGEAYARSIEAAEAAEAVHAYADAHLHLERALSLEDARGPSHAGTARTRLELRRRAADAADLGGALDRALALTRDALSLVDPAADPVTAGLLWSRVGYLSWSVGDPDGALAAHREAVRLVPHDPASPERARVLASLGGALMGAGRWADSRDVCLAAIERAAACGAPAEESRARNMLGSDLVALGEVEAGIAELREACRLAARAGPADLLIVGHYNLALNLAAADRPAEARLEAEAGLAAARAAGLERRFGQDLSALAGDILLRLGLTEEAAQVVGAGLALAPEGRVSVYLAAVSARLAAIRGDLAAAATRLAPVDQAVLDPDVAAYVAAVRAESALWAGRPEEALAAAEAGRAALAGLDDVIWTAPLVALGLRALADLAERSERRRRPAVTEGVPEPGGALVGALEGLEPRVVTSGARGWAALARGELARSSGGPGDAHWAAAAAAFDAVPDPLAAAYARYRGAEEALRRDGLRADVLGSLRLAAGAAQAAGAVPLTRAISDLAGRARLTLEAPAEAAPGAGGAGGSEGRPTEPPAGRPAAAARALGLSPREVEVLELLAAGLTNGEIAGRLFITRKTAGVHVTHILDKLGVANRVAAAMIGSRLGLGQDGTSDARTASPEPGTGSPPVEAAVQAAGGGRR